MSTDTKLLAAQAANKRLRDALEIYSSMSEAMSRPAREALSTPDDTTELDALIADAKRYRHLTAHLEDTDGLLNTLFDKFPGRAPTKEQLDAALDESLLAEAKEATP